MKENERRMEMDELILSTRFMKGIVAKLLSKAISKKLGCDIGIKFNGLEARGEDGRIHIHADVDVEIDNNEFLKIIKSIGLD